MFDWWRRRRHQRVLAKRKRLLEQAKAATELREFVYLDDTSVHSLVASRLGPIASEQTEVEARNWETKAAGKFGADLAVFDAEASIERSGGGSRNTQVLKKSIVQTTFKDLLELEHDGLLLRCGDEAAKAKDAAGVLSRTLTRGALVELDVELDVEPVFRMATVISSLVGIFDRSPELFGEPMQAQFAQGRAVQGVLQAVLGGLVPIRARVLGHTVVGEGDRLRVVHEDAAENNATGAPLFLVGVAEQDLFWKDIRRVLFSRGRFRVLARIAQDGIRDSWTPIKLSHVLDEIIPGFSAQMNAESWQAMLNSRARTQPVPTEPPLGPALTRFIDLVAAHAGGACSPVDVVRAREHAAPFASKAFDFDTWRTETRELTRVLLAEKSVELSPETLEVLRSSARTTEEEDSRGAAIPKHATQAKGARFLDCEFVAIYW